MPADRDMRLGTIFTGRMDATFMTAIRRMRTAVQGAINLAAKQTKAMGGVAAATGKTVAPTNKAAAATKKLTAKADFLRVSVSKSIGAIDRLKSAMKVTASYGVASAAIFTVVNALKSGVTEIVNYDQALKNLQAITGATVPQIGAMGDVMKDVAETTKFSTKEVADGMVLLGQAGFDAGESMAAIQSVADLATGTLSSMQLVTDLLTTTIRAFNLEAVESGRVADVMANAINKSKLTVDKLRIAFGFVGAIASQARLSIEQTAASMGVLANNGLRASTIGTGLRQVLSRLISPSSKLREAYESHGIELEKINPMTAGYEEALKNLAFVLWDTEKQTVDMGKAFGFFGLRGAQAAAILVKSYVSGNFDKMLKNIHKVGSAAEMSGIQQEGLAVKIKNLADRFGLLAVAIGETGAAGAIGSLVDVLRVAVSWVTDLVGTVGGRLVLQFTAWSTSTWLVTKAIRILMATGLAKWIALVSISINAQIMRLGVWTVAVNLAWSAWARLMMFVSAHPFVLVSAAIGGVVAALKLYFSAAEKAAAETEKQIVKQEGAIIALEAYRGALEKLQEKQEKGKDVNLETISLLKRLTTEHDTLKGKIDISTGAWEKNKKALEEAISEAQREKMSQLTTLIDQYGEAIERARIKTGLWVGLKKVFEVLTDAVLWFYQKVFDYVALNLEIMAALAQKIPFVGEKISEAIEIISETLRAGTQNVKDFYSRLGEGSKEAAELVGKEGEAVERLGKMYADMAKAGTMSMEAIAESLKDTYSLSEKQIKEIMAVVEKELKRAGDALKSFTELANERLAAMGAGGTTVFAEMWESASAIQKSELAKMHKQMESELASLKKFLMQNVKDEAERMEALESLRNKHYAKMLEFLKGHAKEAEKIRKDTLDAEILAAQNNAKELINILDDRLKRGSVSAAYYAKEKAEIEKNLAQEMLDLWEAHMDDMAVIYGEDSVEYQKSREKMLDADKALIAAKEALKKADEALAVAVGNTAKASDKAATSTTKLSDLWAKAGGVVSIFKGEIEGLTEAMQKMVRVAFDPSRAAIQQLIQSSVHQINTLLAERATIAAATMFDKYTGAKWTAAINKSIANVQKELKQKTAAIQDYWRRNPILISPTSPITETHQAGGLVGGGGGIVGAGEFVIDAPTVRNFGVRFFESLVAGMQSTRQPIATPKPFTGARALPTETAAVGQLAGRQPVNNYVTISPKYMTGDKAMAREMAVEIQEALDNLKSRWGN